MSERNEAEVRPASGGRSSHGLAAGLLMNQAGRQQSSWHKRWGPLLPFVFFAATVVVRLALAWNLPFNPLTPDCQEYEYLAHNLVETGRYGFSEDWREDPVLSMSPWRMWYDEKGTWRVPGYPAVLAALELTVGPDWRVRQLVLACVEGFTAVLVFYLAKLLFGSMAGIIAALLFVFNPHMCYSLVLLGREPFMAILFVAGFYLVFRAVGSSSPVTLGILAGLCFGLAAYFKQTITYAGLLGALWLVYVGYRYKMRCWRTGLVILVCIPLVMAPWVARNWYVHQKYVGFEGLVYFGLWVGLIEDNSIKNRLQFPVPQAKFYLPEASNAAEAESKCKEQLTNYVKEHPLKVIREMAINVRGFWSPMHQRVWYRGFTEPAHYVSLVYYLPCFFFAAWSFWILRRQQETRLCLLVLLAVTALHSLVVSGPRYRLTFDPLLLVFIGGGLQVWLNRRRSARIPSTPITSSPSDR